MILSSIIAFFAGLAHIIFRKSIVEVTSGTEITILIFGISLVILSIVTLLVGLKVISI